METTLDEISTNNADDTTNAVETQEGSSEELTLDAIEQNLASLVEKYVKSEEKTDSDGYEQFSKRLEALEAENKRLTSALGKMVTVYGARFSDDNVQSGIEAFPQLNMTDPKLDEPQIPLLNDIVLGS